MSINPYESPSAPAIPSSQEPSLHLSALQLAGVVVLFYWSFKLLSDIFYWESVVAMAAGKIMVGPHIRMLQDTFGLVAGMLMFSRVKWLAVPLALHLCVFGSFYFCLTGWPMATGALRAPDLLAILLAEAALFGYAIWMIRKRVLA
ncbi:MAG: hypothetical protein V4631_09745 [Pseudomonadota bacterium]